MVFDIIHKDLKWICFKKKIAQDMAESNKLSRLICAKSCWNDILTMLWTSSVENTMFIVYNDCVKTCVFSK